MEYKGYLITPSDQNPHSYKIATAGRGGKIPDVMGGLFTSRGWAKEVVDLYLESKGRKDNEEVGKG
jgi:hypothetical protein